MRLWIFILVLLSSVSLYGEPIIKYNMMMASPGDFIVASQNKAYTLLAIEGRYGPELTIQEVTAPASRIPKDIDSWRKWFEAGAPGHTCWIRYRMNLETGQMIDVYSFTQKSWVTISQADVIISKLIALDFQPIPDSERRKAGAQPPLGVVDQRPIWQPRLVVDGQQIKGVPFDGWRARWPRDGSELSGKLIEVYLPDKNSSYLGYFPYWLEVQGMIGNAKIRIVDSGKNLKVEAPINKNNRESSKL